MRTFVLLLLLSVVLLSCSKDQRTINRLDGKWNVIAAEIQGYGESNPDLYMNSNIANKKRQTVATSPFTILKRMR